MKWWKILAVLTFLSALSVIGLMLASIWTHGPDAARLFGTAMVGLIPTALLTVATGMAFEGDL